MTHFYQLTFYFIVYSILGWILESIYKTLWEKKLVNSGFMYGPYCPIYGCGTIIMILLLEKLKFNIVLVFLASFIVLSIWEYIVGFFLEKVYNTKYWDYSNYKININGRVCLVNSCYWGVLGVLFIYLVHPFITNLVGNIPETSIIYLDIVLGLTMITDGIVSSVKTRKISEKLDKIKELGEKIKDNISDDIEQITLQYNELKISLYRQLNRMKNAFPTMKSEKINKFLSEKIDIKELKNKIVSLKKNFRNIKPNNVHMKK